MPLVRLEGRRHAWHLYVVRVQFDKAGIDRGTLYGLMRANGIAVNVHYSPVYLHPYYKTKFGNLSQSCSVAENVATEILSLPIFPAMSSENVGYVVDILNKCLNHHG